jgi:ABC-2 type transport system ATP-binding protein
VEVRLRSPLSPVWGSLLGTAATLTGSQSLSAIPGQVAAFPSQPLRDSLLVAGSSTVKLQVTAHGADDATLFASAHHVAANGTDTLPAGLVAPIRLTGLTPGVARTITVALPGIVRNLPAGDRLVLMVATTDLAYQLPSSPRSYTIALSGTDVAVATIEGPVMGAGLPWYWLVTGLAAMAILMRVSGSRRSGAGAEAAGRCCLSCPPCRWRSRIWSRTTAMGTVPWTT